MKKIKYIFFGVFAGLISLIFIIGVIFFISIKKEKDFPKRVISNFAECAGIGNPILETYPRQCIANGKSFTEVIFPKPSMTEAEARLIAEKECIKGGEALEVGMYNDGSKTWWFDANLNAVQEGCNPACVVSEETKTAEINWRCTGLKQ